MRRADGWTGGRAVGTAVLAAMFLAASPPDRLTAQDSQFGIRGLGTPGRWESVRARSTGGAFGPFDGLSPLMEAQLADVAQLTATAAGGTSHRDAEVSGTTTALRATRFPVMGVAGPVGRRFVVAAGFTTYLDKSWDVTLRDSLPLRGVVRPYTDEITSDGSVTDVRLAAASRLSRRIAIGAAVHVLAGSTRMTAERRFDDSTFHPVQQSADVRYDGFGVSGSVLIGLAPGLSIAGWARSDNRLRAKVADTTSAVTDLPLMAGGGLLIVPSASARVAAAGGWRPPGEGGAGAVRPRGGAAGGGVGPRRGAAAPGVAGRQGE